MTQLSSENFAPDAKFRQQLRAELKQRATNQGRKQFNFFNYTALKNFKFTKLQLAAIGSISFSLLAILSLGGYWVFLRTDNDDILAKIASANPNGTTRQQTTEAASADSAKVSSTLLRIAREPGYSYSETTEEKGPKVKECNVGTIYNLPKSTSELFEYYEKSGDKYYSKSIVYDGSRKIVDYYLNLGDIGYQYKGGKYAVKLINQQNFTLAAESRAAETAVDDAGPTSYPTTNTGGTEPTASDPDSKDPEPDKLNPDGTTSSPEEPVSNVDPGSPDEPVKNGETPAPSFKDIFGENGKVIGQEKIDGVNYYVITWEYDIYCQSDALNATTVDAPDFANTKKATVKAWASEKDYTIRKREEYLGAIKPENLLIKASYKSEHQKVNYSKVENKFQMISGIKIKEVDQSANASNSENYRKALENLISKKKISIYKPASGDYTINSFSSDRLDLPDPNSYLRDKDYYSTDQFGQEQYKSAIEIYQPIAKEQLPLISHGYYQNDANKPYSASISVFDKSLSLDKVLSLNVGEVNTNSQSIQINVDGQNKTFKLYEPKLLEVKPSSGVEDGGGSSGQTEPGYCVDCAKNWIVVAEDSQHYYLFNLYGFKSIDEIRSQLKLNEYNSASDSQTISGLIKDANKNQSLIAL